MQLLNHEKNHVILRLYHASDVYCGIKRRCRKRPPQAQECAKAYLGCKCNSSREKRKMMEENIFMKEKKPISFEDYLEYDENSRGNLGGELPVIVYRLLEYSIKDELAVRYGRAEQVEIFRNAGRKAGEFFARKMLNLNQPLDQFVSELQKKMAEMKIGVLRIESVDEESGQIILTVSEDADCSGLPVLGETVCNYDEGFISGILSLYSGKEYVAVETDCWATGGRVCRFQADVREGDV